MADNVVISKTLSIRDCGFDEFWLQDQIAADPSILGLGELEVVKREKRQSSGGKLDMLLEAPEDMGMYEVEVMLGATDESHIIRTIEYWDIERRRWPKRPHTAVLVAEKITRRFFNVIQLMSHSLPIVAIQASLIEAEGKRILHFTSVLDAYEEPEVRLEGSAKVGAEDWAKRAPWCVEIVNALVRILGKVFVEVKPAYRSSYVRLHVGTTEPWFWLKEAAASSASFRFDVGNVEMFSQIKAKLEQKGVTHSCLSEKGEVRLSLDKDAVAQYCDLLIEIAGLVKKSWNL